MKWASLSSTACAQPNAAQPTEIVAITKKRIFFMALISFAVRMCFLIFCLTRHLFPEDAEGADAPHGIP
jgi:hypothetical protein